MNHHPIELFIPVFRWLNRVMAEYGLYIYLVAVWASPFLIAWILRGGFWRRRTTRQPVLVLPVLLVPTASPPSQPVPPPLPPIIEASPQSRLSSDNDVQSFCRERKSDQYVGGSGDARSRLLTRNSALVGYLCHSQRVRHATFSISEFCRQLFWASSSCGRITASI